MTIDFANLPLAYQEHGGEIDEAMRGVMASARLILGKETESLESDLAEFVGTRYALTCSSGTDALLLAMMALGIKSGDEVITSPFTFIASAETIACLGAKPVFVDVEEDTFNIDVKKIETAITPKTKAIMPISLYGQMADMDSINAIADKNGLFVIEDGAQSFGATYKGKRSGSVSKIGCTSFFPAKPLGCFGDGGAVFTNDDEAFEKMKAMRVHGQVARYTHKYIGMGGRLDNLQAAILGVKLKYYQRDIERRQQVAKWYDDRLESKLNPPKIKSNCTSVWAQYTVRVSNRQKMSEKLRMAGIPTAVHYPIPIHLQECFSYLGHAVGSYPISEKLSNEVLSLPMNPYLTEMEVEYICQEINKNLE